ncbi:GGDEF domain-containing protein [Pseudoxanthomonas sp. PXM02]|uniref:tetratricopeptide repeat-containing diguanylate cyclase n=1 Tax=Pseudoxanthomonas sp. PXM02 TaxID=2769294 RepID=UPI00177AF0BE|nr:GGDEF domain-containing protein [Pseudoxanthomonas sp. PXM02]MBD9477636.1 GGDEF domain-containing protein [Pseudoxanthomonas sp. PXM02]
MSAPQKLGFDALLEKAEQVRSANPVEFRQVLREVNARKGEATGDQQAQVAYLNAYALAFAGRFDAAIEAANKLMRSTSSVDMQVRAGSLIVNSYAGTRQFTEGLRQLEQTLALLPVVKDPYLKIHAAVSAAVLYNQIGQHELALQFSEQVLAASKSPRDRCFAGFLKSEAQLKLGEIPNEDKALVSIIDECLANKEVVIANFTRQVLAQKWAAQGERKKAISMLSENLAEIEGTRYPRLVGEVHSLLAQFLLEEQDIEAAEEHANRAAALSANIPYSVPLVAAYRTLYEIAERKGDKALALTQFRKFAEADKAYLNDVNARELAYQIVRQETLQKTQQISALDQKNQVLQLQRKVDQTAAQNTRLIVILLVLLVASIGYWAFKIKRVQLSLKKMAETDALTGICNRHHFTIRAERALAECARNGEQAALIMFDLDHFKNINDRFGHGTGDWALKEVAEASKGFCRRIDVLGRLGGEEFAILMYGCDLRAAARVAEDCRVRLAQIETRETGHVFAITGSFGVTSSQESGYSLAKLLSHADKQLYRAKHNGRNRVCVNDHEQDAVRAASNVLELPHRDRVEHLGA